MCDDITEPQAAPDAEKDLGERHVALEKAFLAIEHKLRLVLQNIRDIVYMADCNGIITFINDTVRRYGYTPEELIGANILDLVLPADRDRASWHVRERRTGDRRTNSFIVRLISKENAKETEQPVFSLTAEGFYDGEGTGQAFIGTVGIVNEIAVRQPAGLQPKLPLDIDSMVPPAAGPPRVRIEINDPMSNGSVELVCSLLDVHAIHHLISICSNCKRIRNEHGAWEDFEEYLSRRYHLDFSHGICSACERELYDKFLHRGEDG